MTLPSQTNRRPIKHSTKLAKTCKEENRNLKMHSQTFQRSLIKTKLKLWKRLKKRRKRKKRKRKLNRFLLVISWDTTKKMRTISLKKFSQPKIRRKRRDNSQRSMQSSKSVMIGSLRLQSFSSLVNMERQ